MWAYLAIGDDSMNPTKSTFREKVSTLTQLNRVKADAILLFVALIWGSAFVFQRLAAGQVGPILFNGMRFLVGVVVLLPFMGRGLVHMTRLEVRGGLLAGLLLFGGAALQQAGLVYTTAGKAGFITGLYVVLVPVLLTLFWKERMYWFTWLASLVAVVGLFLLSLTEELRLAPGDGLVLIGAFVWACHVVLVSKLANKVNVLRLAFFQYLVCGVMSLAVGLLFERGTWSGFSSELIWAVLYTGVISVGVAYTLQLVGQKVAPATDAAIIMSGEAVFAALAGWVFLSELLTPRQTFGSLLILAAMFLAQAKTIFAWKNGAAEH
jgi:drug/metabolite transporter (DMT)-like permease